MVELKKLPIENLPKAQEPQWDHCCLYVIQEAKSEYFKIGIAAHPFRRLSALQGGNRNKLSLVAAYAGTRSSCLFAERAALRFFGAVPHSEWVRAESFDEITVFLDAFVEGEPV